ncbi:Protein of unknown function (Hypoth_ymh) [Ferrithrix thermotolerans DSM 19514]|uniref:Conserved hypothetical protein CHP02391 domain-containing protein n=1 Tax=Ferrithrix thermotolerans DSM 19514 TaxID=1121881 RepID=A0A1M4WDD2_9ACTN|nr:TIGR02391 family protein [Ferrithrix thermotolerans]SHE79291.1 Protein of unknown function (Hypoth_ymh) [Ferrithrix thermotolerans DSM 19514]
MNTAWAVEELDRFIAATELHHVSSPPNVISVGTYKTTAEQSEVVRQAQVIEEILHRVTPDWRSLEVNTTRKPWVLHHEAAIRCREVLVRQDELKRNLGEDAPELSAAELHPWIWGGASSLWQSGHYREAVEGAIRKLNAETQNKVGRRDVSETDLFKQAFSLDVPGIGKPRLRRMQSDGSKTYESLQRGAMSFAEGVFAGIRNH